MCWFCLLSLHVLYCADPDWGPCADVLPPLCAATGSLPRVLDGGAWMNAFFYIIVVQPHLGATFGKLFELFAGSHRLVLNGFCSTDVHSSFLFQHVEASSAICWLRPGEGTHPICRPTFLQSCATRPIPSRRIVRP